MLIYISAIARVQIFYDYLFDFIKFWILDRIFDQDCKTLEVYEARTRDIVAAAVRGFNGNAWIQFTFNFS